jgi:hypothetical protein
MQIDINHHQVDQVMEIDRKGHNLPVSQQYIAIAQMLFEFSIGFAAIDEPVDAVVTQE